MTRKGISLAIVPRSSNDHANSGSGNRAPDLAAIARLMPKKLTNRCRRSVMTVPQNKEPRIGSPTLQTNKTM